MMASRAVAPVPAAPAAEPGRTHARVQRAALKVSDPNDAAEREAEATARRVMTMPHPAIAPRERVSLLAARAPAVKAQPRAKANETAPEVTEAIKAARGGGSALSAKTRAFMEPRFKASFAGVRIHTGKAAADLNEKLGARAFAYGRDIFFSPGAYQPDTPAGQELLAHELTHTIQQREVVQREATVQERTTPHVQRGLLGAISDAAGAIANAAGAALDAAIKVVKDFVADKAGILPGFRLLTLIIGKNPINDQPVSGGGAAILREIVGFIPFGDKIVEAFNNHGIFEKGGAFVDTQFKNLRHLGGALISGVKGVFSKIGLGDATNPGGVWDRITGFFSTAFGEIKAFGVGLVSGVVTLVRETIIPPLGRWAAANIPKWDLLMAVLGKNPVSDDQESPASQIIGAFMNLIGQGEIWENIKKGNAVNRAWQWFQTALKGAKSLVSGLPGQVMATLRSFTIMDVLTIAGAFKKLLGLFGSFVGQFGSWAGGTVLSLLEIILSVVAPTVVPYLKKAGGAFNTIIKNPAGFVRTLVAAGKQGFSQFAGNFLTHLKASLVSWLTGALGGAGIYIPQGFTVLEILKFVLSVLGLTWANIRAKLVAATNETTVKALETGFDIVKTLVTDGPAAAWKKIVETLTNLKQMAIDAIMDFVKSKVVEAAVTKLLSMLSPAGAFIQAIIAIYNTIMFFVERIRTIAQVAASFIDGIAAIAAGNIAPAANRVEQTMAGLLTLVISFLARIAGLGKVSDAVLGLINKVRAPVMKALDSVVAWIVATAKKLGKMVVKAADGAITGGPKSPEQIKAIVERAKKELPPKIDALLSSEPSKIKLRAKLLIWRAQYQLSSLELKEAGEDGNFSATVNPTFSVGEGVKVYVGDAQLLSIVNDEAAKAVKDHPTVRKEARRVTRKSRAIQQAAAAGNPGQTLNVQSTKAMVGAASAVIHPVHPNSVYSPLPPIANLAVGVDAAGNVLVVSSVRRNPQSEANRVVRGEADGQGAMSPYSTHRKTVGRDSDAGVNAITALGAGEQLAIEGEKAKKAAEFFATMHNQETIRRPENVAFTAMTTQLMAQGDVTFAQGTRMHPATRVRNADKKEPSTPKGQEELAAAAEKAMKDGKPMTGSATMQALREQSVNLVTAWIRSRLAAGDQPITKNKQALLIWIRKAVRKRIDEFIEKGS